MAICGIYWSNIIVSTQAEAGWGGFYDFHYEF